MLRNKKVAAFLFVIILVLLAITAYFVIKLYGPNKFDSTGGKYIPDPSSQELEPHVDIGFSELDVSPLGNLPEAVNSYKLTGILHSPPIQDAKGLVIFPINISSDENKTNLVYVKVVPNTKGAINHTVRIMGQMDDEGRLTFRDQSSQESVEIILSYYKEKVGQPMTFNFFEGESEEILTNHIQSIASDAENCELSCQEKWNRHLTNREETHKTFTLLLLENSEEELSGSNMTPYLFNMYVEE